MSPGLSGSHAQTSSEYRGLLMRITVFRVSQAQANPHWGYDVSVWSLDAPLEPVAGPFSHASAYDSSDDAHAAADRRGRLASDLILDGA